MEFQQPATGLRHELEVSRRDYSIILLIVAAIGALAFTSITGIYIRRNTQELITAAKWVEHTQEVLTALQSAAQLTERITYSTHLYVATGQETELSTARTAGIRLQTLTLRLKTLVADNSNETPNVVDLLACSEDISHSLESWSAHPETPRREILRCQHTLSIMTEQERWLLKDRNEKSSHRSLISFSTELVFVGVSLMTLAVLFTVLLRNAVLRRRGANEMRTAHQRLAHSVSALEEKAHESQLLTSSRDELQLCNSPQQVFQSATSNFARLLPRTSGSLCMLNNSRHMVEVVSSWGESPLQHSGLDLFVPESCCGLRSGHLRWRRPGASEIDCDHFGTDLPLHYLCMPMVAHGDTLGVLYVECADEKVCDTVEKHMDGLRQLLQLTGMAVGSLNLRKNLEHQSIRDSLTGLFNRHFMETSLERELSRAMRRKSMLAVLMLDIDHFKRFNDEFGHAAGDTILKAAADVFRSSVRAEDVVCRYGGEEFTILLPEITVEAAFMRAETIRRSVAELRVPVEGSKTAEITISIGIAVLATQGESTEELLGRADQALYQSKRSGRNTVTFTDGPNVVTSNRSPSSDLITSRSR